jgi:hypothetical protein
MLARTNFLNASTFDGLLDFCRATNLTLIFNLNEVFGRTGCGASEGDLAGTCVGEWDSAPVEELLRYMREAGAVWPTGPLVAVELGNELSAHLGWQAQAADYLRLADILEDVFAGTSARPRLLGPATDSCANMAAFLNATSHVLQGFTAHSYPVGGDLAARLLDPDTLRAIPNATACYAAAWSPFRARMTFALSESNSDAATVANAGQATFVNGFWLA